MGRQMKEVNVMCLNVSQWTYGLHSPIYIYLKNKYCQQFVCVCVCMFLLDD